VWNVDGEVEGGDGRDGGDCGVGGVDGDGKPVGDDGVGGVRRVVVVPGDCGVGGEGGGGGGVQGRGESNSASSSSSSLSNLTSHRRFAAFRVRLAGGGEAVGEGCDSALVVQVVLMVQFGLSKAALAKAMAQDSLEGDRNRSRQWP
jgi:hypothetical protein